ncbi:MAG: hypothetical protein PF569_10300 [Candidatus Woesearchaeota archaeon]|jgi:hypothetical protein|nr:hypothetical protein [Candidatus Woesearchaeota archaeon]
MKLTKDYIIEGKIIKAGSEINITEGKQVGISYHFTWFYRCLDILTSNSLISDNIAEINGKDQHYISLTRDYSLRTPMKTGEWEMWGDCRIVLDGDKLSNKYRVVPFYDKDWLGDKSKSYGISESENAILTKRIDPLSPYVLQVDILEKVFHKSITAMFSFKLDKVNDNKYIHTPTGIIINLVDKFKPYR